MNIVGHKRVTEIKKTILKWKNGHLVVFGVCVIIAANLQPSHPKSLLHITCWKNQTEILQLNCVPKTQMFCV